MKLNRTDYVLESASDGGYYAWLTVNMHCNAYGESPEEAIQNLQNIMNGMIDEMYKCIEDKKYDEAEKIVDILDKKTNGYADGISKARILISRGKRREAN